MIATIIVALAVGLLSGLLGSVAGPWFSHRLDRARRRELREEERRRDLRKMLETQMQAARFTMSSMVRLEIGTTIGQQATDIVQAYIDRVRNLYDKTSFVWRPARIHDERLRDLSESLNAVDQSLSNLMDRRMLEASVAEWGKQTNDLASEISRLIGAIDQRLDELNW